MTEHTQHLIDWLRYDVDKWFFEYSANIPHDCLDKYAELNTLAVEAQKAITYMYGG